jgi:hypothetical protein
LLVLLAVHDALPVEKKSQRIHIALLVSKVLKFSFLSCDELSTKMSKKDAFSEFASFGTPQKPLTLQEQMKQSVPRQPMGNPPMMTTTPNTMSGIPNTQKPIANPNAFADLLGGTGLGSKPQTSLNGKPMTPMGSMNPQAPSQNTSRPAGLPQQQASVTRPNTAQANPLAMLDPLNNQQKQSSFQFTPAVANQLPFPIANAKPLVPMNSPLNAPMNAKPISNTNTQPVEEIKWSGLDMLDSQPVISKQTQPIDPFDIAFLEPKVQNASLMDDNPLGLLSLPTQAVHEIKKQEEPKVVPLATVEPDQDSESNRLQNQVLELMKMGFSEDIATNALLQCDLNIEKAANMLLNQPVTESSIGSGSANQPELTGEEKDIQVLLSMGFKANLCRQALRASNGDVDAAIGLLLRQKQSRRVSFNDNLPADTLPESSKIVETASSFGLSMLKNAKNVLQFSKKKVEEVIVKATSDVKKQEEPPEEWSRPKFRDESPKPVQQPKKVQQPQVTSRPYTPSSKPIDASNSLGGDSEEADVPLQRRASVMVYNLLSMDSSIPSQPKPSIWDTPAPKPTASKPTTTPSPQKQVQVQKPVPVSPSKPQVHATQEQRDKSEQLKTAGNDFFKQGQYASAESQYTLAIEALPPLHDLLLPLYNNRAACRLKNGDPRGACADCDYILEKSKDDIKALLRRANAYEMMEKWEAARDDYRVIMGLDPNVKGVSAGLARVSNALAPKSTAVVESIPQTATKPMAASVKRAVDDAVQKLRDQNIQSEQEESEKFAVLDMVNAKVLDSNVD